MLAQNASQVSIALRRRPTFGFAVAGVKFGLGLLAIVTGEFAGAIFPLSLALWTAWRAASLVPEATERLEERERNEWRALATGPVMRCPRCEWVSHNANVTHCVDCGTSLERVPPRSLS